MKAISNPNTKDIIVRGTVYNKPALNSGKNELESIPTTLTILSDILTPLS
jgi:hypothetical protein